MSSLNWQDKDLILKTKLFLILIKAQLKLKNLIHQK